VIPLRALQVKVWFQNRRMKWKRTKGAQLARDKVTGQLKPVVTLEPPLNYLHHKFVSAATDSKPPRLT